VQKNKKEEKQEQRQQQKSHADMIFHEIQKIEKK
jgi:hypothetical protein